MLDGLQSGVCVRVCGGWGGKQGSNCNGGLGLQFNLLVLQGIDACTHVNILHTLPYLSTANGLVL